MKKLLVVIVCLLLAGCATKVDWTEIRLRSEADQWYQLGCREDGILVVRAGHFVWEEDSLERDHWVVE